MSRSMTMELPEEASSGQEESSSGGYGNARKNSQTDERHSRFQDSDVDRDVFAAACRAFSIAEVWRLLGYGGEPKAACKSPFREDKVPSFSIYGEGRAFKDHATGEGGDVVEFVKLALGGYSEARQWFKERLELTGWRGFAPVSPPPAIREISWPAPLVEGKPATWIRFAEHRGLSATAVGILVKANLLRFTKIDGAGCFVVTDGTRRAAEIRRIDGTPFGKSKAFPLSGVDKTWLPGAEWLKDAPADVSVLITEGATDFLSAVDLYVRYRRERKGRLSWVVLAILGASCKLICRECAELVRGRHVRIVPDADEAGDRMRDHWKSVFHRLDCPVDTVTLDRGTDLTDCAKEINIEALFRV